MPRGVGKDLDDWRRVSSLSLIEFSCAGEPGMVSGSFLMIVLACFLGGGTLGVPKWSAERLRFVVAIAEGSEDIKIGLRTPAAEMVE
jgi:hypothetical protein